MNAKIRIYRYCLYAATLSLTTGTAFAGVTSTVEFVIPAGSVSNEVVDTVLAGANPINIAPVQPSPNTWTLEKTFTSLDPIDIGFSAVNSLSGSTTTEYVVNETVTNNTGLDWIGYTVQLGFDSGSNFISSATPDGLDFDEEEFSMPGSYYQPTSTVFGICTACLPQDTLIFAGGVLPAGATDTITYHVDVPNDSNVLPDYKVNGGFTFTLRQTPTVVPTPASFGLMLSALVSISAGFWRRQGVRGGHVRLARH